jgi:hypothetical protein
MTSGPPAGCCLWKTFTRHDGHNYQGRALSKKKAKTRTCGKDETRQDKTRQDKGTTRQDKIRQRQGKDRTCCVWKALSRYVSSPLDKAKTRPTKGQDHRKTRGPQDQDQDRRPKPETKTQDQAQDQDPTNTKIQDRRPKIKGQHRDPRPRSGTQDQFPGPRSKIQDRDQAKT